jgi:hypothetical protein
VNKKFAGFLFATALLAAAAAVWSGYQASVGSSELHGQVVLIELQAISTLLKENQALIEELQSEPFGAPGTGILESYLARIRRDGVAKHADMKQRLDQLAENNTAIVTLIKVYAPQARTPAFKTESDKFRNYASAWRDRWNSVMELFMAGGGYAASGIPFPDEFAAAVDAEIAAAK